MPEYQTQYEDFAKNRPLGVVALGANGTQSIGSIREFMELRRAGKGLFAYEPPVDEQEWFTFYRYRTLKKAIANLLLAEDARLIM